MDRHEITGTAPDQYQALHFAGCSAPIYSAAGDDLAAGLLNCLTGWDHSISVEPAPDPASQPLLAVVARSGPHGTTSDLESGYFVASRYSDRPTGRLGLASAACSLIADLSLDWAESAPQMLALHAGAVEVGGEIIALIGPARAGKSTFTTRLALEPEVRFICDDVLPVDFSGHGHALGIAPRLRLPLPPNAARLQRLLVDARLLEDRRYAYVAPPLMASHGDRVPLGAIVLIERRGDLPAGLYALETGEAVSLLLRQSLTGFADAAEAFAQISQLVSRLPMARLVFEDLEQGTQLLTEAWQDKARWSHLPDLPSTSLPSSMSKAPSLENRASLTLGGDAGTGPEAEDMPPNRLSNDQVLSQNVAAVLRRTGSRSWLWLPDEAKLWELNATSLAIWSMLDEPGSAEDLAQALAEVYPQVSYEKLREDTALMLTELYRAGFLYEYS